MRKIVFLVAFLLLLPTEGYAFSQSGIASYYWQPQPVACGGRFNPNAMTAAHKTLPCGSKVQVKGKNGKTVTVTINDRGPYIRGRIIDLSLAAAKKMGMTKSGLMKVTIRRI
jgi:rare lipoprotein A